MRTYVFLFLVGLILFNPALLRAASPLVSADWIVENHQKSGIVFLDVRHPRSFADGTVPGAVNTNYSLGWRVKRNGVPGLLPSGTQLQKLMQSLGIKNADHVVILPGGYSASEMGVATRIYWTFKVAGHKDVSILNGGMQALFALGKKAPVGRGNSKPDASDYKVTLVPELIATGDDIDAAREQGQSLIDHRPPGQFLGINSGGSPKRKGTLSSAENIPAQWLTVDDGGTFRSKSALEKLFKSVGKDPSAPTINFCNTGHWASVGWFVTHEIVGNKKSRLYDGSMAEWTANPKNAVEQKMSID